MLAESSFIRGKGKRRLYSQGNPGRLGKKIFYELSGSYFKWIRKERTR